MAVRNSPEADADIAIIYAYGMDDYGQAAAEMYLFGLFVALDDLAANPYRAPIRLRHGDAEVRLLRYRAHHVFYSVENQDVVVVRVLHGSADWTNLL